MDVLSLDRLSGPNIQNPLDSFFDLRALHTLLYLRKHWLRMTAL